MDILVTCSELNQIKKSCGKNTPHPSIPCKLQLHQGQENNLQLPVPPPSSLLPLLSQKLGSCTSSLHTHNGTTKTSRGKCTARTGSTSEHYAPLFLSG